MRWLLVILIMLLVGLSYRLMVGEGSFAHKAELEAKIADQKGVNSQLKTRHDIIVNEVKDLKSGQESIEERARSDLGMIKNDETFYFVVDPKQATPDNSTPDAQP